MLLIELIIVRYYRLGWIWFRLFLYDDDVVENFWKFWETEINVFVVDRGNFFSFQNTKF